MRIRQDELVDTADWTYVRQMIRDSHQRTKDELALLNKGNFPDAELQLAFDKVTNHIKQMEQRLAQSDRTLDESWFICDAQGRQIYRFPDAGKSLSDSFHWRDYFHGRERSSTSRSPRQGGRGPRPACRSLTSAPRPASTRSPSPRRCGTKTRRPSWGSWPAASTSPIFSINGSRRSGRRGGRKTAFSRCWRRGNRPHLLDHLRIEEALKRVRTREQGQVILRVSPAVEKAAETTDRLEDYRDPIAQLDPGFDGPWLAAFYPVGNTGWTAVVQERRNLTLEPLGQMQGVLTRGGIDRVSSSSASFLACSGISLHRASLSQTAPGEIEGDRPCTTTSNRPSGTTRSDRMRRCSARRAATG